VDERFEKAIDDAKKVDVMLQSGDLSEEELKEKYPLLGVPFTIKDSFCVQGKLNIFSTARSYIHFFHL